MQTDWDIKQAQYAQKHAQCSETISAYTYILSANINKHSAKKTADTQKQLEQKRRRSAHIDTIVQGQKNTTKLKANATKVSAHTNKLSSFKQKQQTHHTTEEEKRENRSRRFLVGPAELAIDVIRTVLNFSISMGF